MLTGVVVSASSFLWVVIILYGFINVDMLKIKNPAMGSPGFYLGLQLISISDQKRYPAANFNWCHQLLV